MEVMNPLTTSAKKRTYRLDDSAFVNLEQCAEAEVMEDSLVLLAEDASEEL